VKTAEALVEAVLHVQQTSTAISNAWVRPLATNSIKF